MWWFIDAGGHFWSRFPYLYERITFWYRDCGIFSNRNFFFQNFESSFWYKRFDLEENFRLYIKLPYKNNNIVT